MKCKQCNQEFEPTDIKLGHGTDDSFELVAECSNSDCDARYYAFIPKDSWEKFED